MNCNQGCCNPLYVLHLARDKNQNGIYFSSERFTDMRCSAWMEASLSFSLLETANAAHSCTLSLLVPFLATEPHLYFIVMDGAIVTRVSKNKHTSIARTAVLSQFPRIGRIIKFRIGEAKG